MIKNISTLSSALFVNDYCIYQCNSTYVLNSFIVNNEIKIYSIENKWQAEFIKFTVKAGQVTYLGQLDIDPSLSNLIFKSFSIIDNFVIDQQKFAHYRPELSARLDKRLFRLNTHLYKMQKINKAHGYIEQY